MRIRTDGAQGESYDRARGTSTSGRRRVVCLSMKDNLCTLFVGNVGKYGILVRNALGQFPHPPE